MQRSAPDRHACGDRQHDESASRDDSPPNPGKNKNQGRRTSPEVQGCERADLCRPGESMTGRSQAGPAISRGPWPRPLLLVRSSSNVAAMYPVWIPTKLNFINTANSIDTGREMSYVRSMARRGRSTRSADLTVEGGQLGLFAPPKKRGGKRRGAGRPAKGKRSSESHKQRPFLHDRYPVHIVLRTVRAVGGLRRRCIWQAIRAATLTTALREDFRIVHVSLQSTHVHLIVEAANKAALARGMQGFQISAAKHLNAAISRGRPGTRRRGTVFPDRYHAEIITSPTQARHTLSYVMNNWRKHQEDRKPATAGWTIDWFSTAAMFPGWKEYGDEAFLWRGPPSYDPLVVYQPRTWLLREGWKKAGTVSCHEVPSKRRVAPRARCRLRCARWGHAERSVHSPGQSWIGGVGSWPRSSSRGHCRLAGRGQRCDRGRSWRAVPCGPRHRTKSGGRAVREDARRRLSRVTRRRLAGRRGSAPRQTRR
jgi:REP-associated tyrosine transposase